MGTRRYLVTAALPYSNGRLHVGHIAGAYLPSDIYVRYLRAKGAEVRFICGSDDNGVAALKTAREQGIGVEELTAHFNQSQRESFAGLGIEFDIYGGTHQLQYVELHERISQDFFLTINEKGYFAKRRSSSTMRRPNSSSRIGTSRARAHIAAAPTRTAISAKGAAGASMPLNSSNR